ncbi:hypothetical protein ACP4OV_014897 [Aristida adscensionis]
MVSFSPLSGKKRRRKWEAAAAPATGGVMGGAKPPPAPQGGKQDLEEVLLQIVQQQHHHHDQSLRERQQTVRGRPAERGAGLLLDAVDGGVQGLFVNEKRIELEASALLAAVARYREQADDDQWLGATSAINWVLKEFVDFENWMKIMDSDSYDSAFSHNDRKGRSSSKVAETMKGQDKHASLWKAVDTSLKRATASGKGHFSL